MRIMAMLMVIVLHALGHGGVLDGYAIGSVGSWFFSIIEFMAYIAVNLFVMISGYFGINSHMKRNRIIHIVMQVEFYSILGMILARFCFHRPIGLADLVKGIFPITSGRYWFASAYVVLIILSPILNYLIQSMKYIQLKRTVFLLLALFVVIPTLFPWSSSVLTRGNDFVWFITLYVIAAYLKLSETHSSNMCKMFENNLSVKQYILTWLCISVAGGVSRIFIGVVTKEVLGQVRGVGVFYRYNSIPVVLATICMFKAFRKLEIKSRKVSEYILYLSSGAFGVYLLTDNPYIRMPLWNYIHLIRLIPYGILPTLAGVAIITLLFYLIGIGIEWLRVKVFKILKVEQLVGKMIDCMISFLLKCRNCLILSSK